jgi:hypothetical protein
MTARKSKGVNVLHIPEVPQAWVNTTGQVFTEKHVQGGGQRLDTRAFAKSVNSVSRPPSSGGPRFFSE